MANHALPTTTSLYTDVLTNLKDRIDDNLKMLDSVNTSPTNIPTNSIRWNSTTTLWEKYNGSSWISLAASYAIKVLKSTNLVGGNGTTLLGSIPYQSGTDTTTLLAPNTTTTRKFLRQTGTGTNGAAPVWDTILASDIPTLNQNTTGSSGSCTGNSATATTATNVNGGSVTATTGIFSEDVVASRSITIGTGGNYTAGSIFSDSSWGMIFRAKQASPSQAIFRWADAADTELFRWNGSALTCSITGTATNANNLGGNAPSYYQQALGFTPIQQGGGAGQSTNKIYIGWQGPYLRCQIDATDFGTTFPMNISGNAASASAFNTAVGSAPSYACRAWVNFNGTGTVAIRASGNVSSITDNGTGDYTVNFTTAMPDVNYSSSTTGGDGGQYGGGYSVMAPYTQAPTVSSVRLGAWGTTGVFIDYSYINLSIFR